LPPNRREYRHFCVLARTLELVAERWSLLIVRDLLAGRQRFSDLQHTLAGITPKRLTHQLRELEVAGIVERDQEPGRREVWYQLTDKGRDLGPAIEALSSWGAKHARRAPLPGEPVHPGPLMRALASTLNVRGVRTKRSRVWQLRFVPGGDYAIGFDGTRWETPFPDDPAADVVVETTPEAWATFLMATPAARAKLAKSLSVAGAPAAIAEFLSILGVSTTQAPHRRS
jgi:DNA-binding HxlR family transcriptional regulator